MTDVHIASVAARQFNRVSRRQLLALGVTDDAIEHRVATGRLVPVAQGVFCVGPVLVHDEWGHWMGATLTAPGSVLSHESAAAAWGVWGLPREHEVVTRPGSGGPRCLDTVLVHRSETLEGDWTRLRGVPVTTPARTAIDLAPHISERALARLLRDVLRLRLAGLREVGDALGRHRGRRGTARLGRAVARYTGLPVERARSGAEVRALEVLKGGGLELPRLNVRIAGEEADLSWAAIRLIIEIDGGPFHLDVGEDRRKEERWRAAGWSVRRISSDEVYERPERLLALARGSNVRGYRL